MSTNINNASQSFEERVAEAEANVPSISPQAVRANCDDAVIVDPRPAKMIRDTTGLITGAFNIPLAELEADYLPSELSDSGRPVIAVCGAGHMSAVAAYVLKRRGFKNVTWMAGGTQAWLAAGYPTQK
jgi:rhodanese-related sulfurtransferase